MVAAYLVAQAARPTVDPHSDPPRYQPERAGRLLIIHLGDLIDLEEMVARPQRANLIAPPIPRPSADCRGVGLLHSPAILGVLQVALGPLAVAHRPGRALLQDADQFLIC